jgi:hypothetical protein
MRKYEPIWLKLKREGTAAIAAHPLLHARVIKAVIKEKWLDQGYKLQLLPYYTVLTYKKEGAKITFSLSRFLSPHIGASDV